MSEKKMGRPTEKVKDTKLTVRLDNDSLHKLNNYCDKNDTTKAQALRDGINKLDEK